MTETVKIRVDHREAACGHIARLKALPNTEVEVCVLDVGDYEIGKGTVVERKSANDFAASIIDRRLFTQLKLAQETGHSVIYVVEGDIYSPNRNLHPNALIGAISMLAAIERVPVLPVQSSLAAQMIHTLARHVQYGLGYEINLREPRPKPLADQQRYLVQGLTGIGVEKAARLLEHFETPRKLMAASRAQLSDIDGFGPKSAAAIEQLLDTSYSPER